MIEVKQLTRSFRDCVAVNDVSFTVPSGQFTVITGRSGSGKSTLLKCMSGLTAPSVGQVVINGEDICRFSDAERSRFRNRVMGFVFQSYALEPKYTAFENVELPMLIRGEKSSVRKERVTEIASFVGVSDLLAKRTELLSGGERQRVAIARALVNQPEILFADEPCGNLDKQNSETVINLLFEINAKGTTVVMVTHQPQDIVKSHMTVELLDGRIQRIV